MFGDVCGEDVEGVSGLREKFAAARGCGGEDEHGEIVERVFLDVGAAARSFPLAALGVRMTTLLLW
jgi:hypothetical protein